MPDFVDVRDPDGKLLFRIDKERALVEIQRRGRKQIIDLSGVPDRQNGEKDADVG